MGSKGRRLGGMIVILMLGIDVLNMGYCFDGTGALLGSFTFNSRLFCGEEGDEAEPFKNRNRFSGNILGDLPTPCPREYLLGVDLQLREFEVGKPSYLHGTWRERGWWYYYLYALTLKMPLGIVIVAVLAVAFQTIRWQRWSTPDRFFTWRSKGTVFDEIVLLAPGVFLVILVSSQTGFSRYFRYLLPALPYAFVWISAFGCAFRSALVRRAVATLLTWSACSSLWCYPHCLSYFNEVTGGPAGGADYLLDAQLDWGQDLLFLKRWLDVHQETDGRLQLAYFGPIDPRLAGIEFTLPPLGTASDNDRSYVSAMPASLQPGLYAVSVNFLYGYPHRAPDGGGRWQEMDRPYVSYFRRCKPIGKAGYSIYIYRLRKAELDTPDAS